MIFSKQYETRWHDTDACRTLRPGAMLTYFEETADLHVRSNKGTKGTVTVEGAGGHLQGKGREDLSKEGKFKLISRVRRSQFWSGQEMKRPGSKGQT